jgi:hypothetical protein
MNDDFHLAADSLLASLLDRCFLRVGHDTYPLRAFLLVAQLSPCGTT